MKKLFILFSIIMCLSITNILAYDLLLSENFTGASIPAGWGCVITSGGGCEVVNNFLNISLRSGLCTELVNFTNYRYLVISFTNRDPKNQLNHGMRIGMVNDSEQTGNDYMAFPDNGAGVRRVAGASGVNGGTNAVVNTAWTDINVTLNLTSGNITMFAWNGTNIEVLSIVSPHDTASNNTFCLQSLDNPANPQFDNLTIWGLATIIPSSISANNLIPLNNSIKFPTENISFIANISSTIDELNNATLYIDNILNETKEVIGNTTINSTYNTCSNSVHLTYDNITFSNLNNLTYNANLSIKCGSASNLADYGCFYYCYNGTDYEQIGNMTGFASGAPICTGAIEGNYTIPNRCMIHSETTGNSSISLKYISSGSGSSNWAYSTPRIFLTIDLTNVLFYFNKIISSIGNHTWFVRGCDINNNCTNSSAWNFNISNIKINSINYTSPVIEGTLENITANISLATGVTLSNAYFTYNNTNSTPSIASSGDNYILTTSVVSPSVGTDTNISFYYSFVINGTTTTSNTYQQLVTNLNVSTDCTTGYAFLNITNFEEDLLTPMNGTVEFVLNLLNNNNQIVTLNGSATNTSITFCSGINLTNSYIAYSLQLRYYSPDLLYFYETYNVQNNIITNIPISIPLYYLNKSLGTQFKINYVDFNYLTYPGAIIQIQRQYLSENIYRIVEIPQINNDGQAVGAFSTSNIRYKIIVINNGVILDTFNDVFPSCQNIILGTCELNLRGSQGNQTTTSGDFTYTLIKTNSSLILTYIIPSGTPRTITFVTDQYSRFLSNITDCNTSIFASGGTITCPYNATIGDSIINTQIINSDGTILYGSVMISEDLSSFFMLNNFVIAFVLLLSIGLMFISSAVMIVIGAVVGLIYLGLIFLLRGADLVTISSSIAWLIVAVVAIIYYISKKEEHT